MSPHPPKTPEAKARMLKGLLRTGKKGARSGRSVDLGVFCIAFLKNNFQIKKTAQQLKIGRPTIYRYLKLPEFDATMAKARDLLLRETAKETAKKMVREITVDRNDIIMGLADLAKGVDIGDRARVAAYLGLADIFMLRTKNIRDADKFYGWTADELEHFAVTAEIPERFRPTTGSSLSSEASLRTEKI